MAKRTGLVLQGGGARGAYQVGVLRAIADILGSRKNPFPIISGTSVGAINTSSLASMANDFIEATNRLEKLWLGLNSHSIFDARTSAILGTIWRIIRTFGFGGKTNRYGLLDNRPLRRLLENEFSREGVEAGFKSGALEGLCITTACYASGLFPTWAYLCWTSGCHGSRTCCGQCYSGAKIATEGHSHGGKTES